MESDGTLRGDEPMCCVWCEPRACCCKICLLLLLTFPTAYFWLRITILFYSCKG